MNSSSEAATVLILGTAQDGGYPQAGCRELCCMEAWKNPEMRRLVASLAIWADSNCWLIDITPDFKQQMKMLEEYSPAHRIPAIAGIFITHAHMGHYLGLLELGLEVMNTDRVPVYVMPGMRSFLETNQPFTQLIESKNIHLKTMAEDTPIQLNENISIMPFLVPHRNEFSETVGYQIQSSTHSMLYLPDIDSWEAWKVDINELIVENDILLLDGTFYDKFELQNRDVTTIPHPSIRNTMKRFSVLDKIDRKKVYFTHLNHTNNVLRPESTERSDVIKKGFQIAQESMAFTI